MLAAVKYARSALGVVAVSMSRGQAEYAGETVDDVTFTTPAGHTPEDSQGSATSEWVSFQLPG